MIWLLSSSVVFTLCCSRKWDEAIAIVRHHCASPEVLADLQKLKTAGLSQHMFPIQHQQQQQQHRSSSTASPAHGGNMRGHQPCRNFARGRCSSGVHCRFSHTALPATAPQANTAEDVRFASIAGTWRLTAANDRHSWQTFRYLLRNRRRHSSTEPWSSTLRRPQAAARGSKQRARRMFLCPTMTRTSSLSCFLPPMDFLSTPGSSTQAQHLRQRLTSEIALTCASARFKLLQQEASFK